MPKVSTQSVNYSIGHKDSHCDKSFEGDKAIAYILSCRFIRN
jgi:hypothetical protein